MSFYPVFDDHFVQTLMRKHEFSLIDFADKSDQFGFTLNKFFESANPLIFFIFDELTSELIDKLNEYDLSDYFIDKIQERLYDSTHINACCSSLSCLDAFEDLEDDIKDELINNDKLDEFGELKALFMHYDC